MIWASNQFSGSGLYFRVRAAFGPELVGPFTTLVRILLLLKLPILLLLNYVQMLLLPVVILTFLLLHVQTWIYSWKAKITATFVPNGFEPIPAPTNKLNSASEVAKSFLISKTNCPAHRRSQGSRPPPPIEMSPMRKMWQKSLLFLQFRFLPAFFAYNSNQ